MAYGMVLSVAPKNLRTGVKKTMITIIVGSPMLKVLFLMGISLNNSIFCFSHSCVMLLLNFYIEIKYTIVKYSYCGEADNTIKYSMYQTYY